MIPAYGGAKAPLCNRLQRFSISLNDFPALRLVCTCIHRPPSGLPPVPVLSTLRDILCRMAARVNKPAYERPVRPFLRWFRRNSTKPCIERWGTTSEACQGGDWRVWFREEGLSVPLRKVPPGLPERLLGMNVIAGLPWEATFRCISRMPCKGFRTRRSLNLIQSNMPIQVIITSQLPITNCKEMYFSRVSL